MVCLFFIPSKSISLYKVAICNLIGERSSYIKVGPTIFRLTFHLFQSPMYILLCETYLQRTKPTDITHSFSTDILMQ